MHSFDIISRTSKNHRNVKLILMASKSARTRRGNIKQLRQAEKVFISRIFGNGPSLKKKKNEQSSKVKRKGKDKVQSGRRLHNHQEARILVPGSLLVEEGKRWRLKKRETEKESRARARTRSETEEEETTGGDEGEEPPMRVEGLWESQRELVKYLCGDIEKQELKTQELYAAITKLRVDLDEAEGGEGWEARSCAEEGRKGDEEMSRLAKEFITGTHPLTRTYCDAQIRFLKILKEKLVKTQRALCLAAKTKETLERRLERKQRRSLIVSNPSTSQSRGTQKSDFTSRTLPQPSPATPKRHTTKKHRKNAEESSPIVLLVDNRPPPETAVKPSIEVPRFRVVEFPEGSGRMTRTDEEALEDDVFDRRHAKLENEEKRIVRSLLSSRCLLEDCILRFVYDTVL